MKHDRQCEKRDVNQCDAPWNGMAAHHLIGNIRVEREFFQPAVADEGEHDRIENHGNNGTPADVADHEIDIPMPLGRDHEHWRCREGGECTTDRDVHEEGRDDGILEADWEIVAQELFADEQCGNRHGGRFGDE